MPSLRERKKLSAMYKVQDVALSMFRQRGFDQVSIEEIADAADLSPATVYRYFDTKDGIVFWDQHDTILAEVLTTGDITTLNQIRDAILVGLAEIYDTDTQTILARTRLIYREPSLQICIPQRMEQLAAQFAGLLAHPQEPELPHHVLARAATGALQTAIDYWQRTEASTPLAGLVIEAFAAIDPCPKSTQ